VASVRKSPDIPLSAGAIRDNLLAHLKRQAWAHTGLLNIIVTNGVVDLRGFSDSDAERKAIRVAAENLVTRPLEGWA
jgi:hypothetical protein